LLKFAPKVFYVRPNPNADVSFAFLPSPILRLALEVFSRQAHRTAPQGRAVREAT
jgi:hypothetical protein